MDKMRVDILSAIRISRITQIQHMSYVAIIYILIYISMYMYVYIYIYIYIYINTRRSQCPRVLRRRSAAARLIRLWVRIPPGTWMFVCCECCVLSGRGLCDELITRPEESYRMWWVVVWSRNLVNEEAMAHWGAVVPDKKMYIYIHTRAARARAHSHTHTHTHTHTGARTTHTSTHTRKKILRLTKMCYFQDTWLNIVTR